MRYLSLRAVSKCVKYPCCSNTTLPYHSKRTFSVDRQSLYNFRILWLIACLLKLFTLREAVQCLLWDAHCWWRWRMHCVAEKDTWLSWLLLLLVIVSNWVSIRRTFFAIFVALWLSLESLTLSWPMRMDFGVTVIFLMTP